MKLPPLIRPPYLDDPIFSDTERARRVACRTMIMGMHTVHPTRIGEAAQKFAREIVQLRNKTDEKHWAAMIAEARRHFDEENAQARGVNHA